jgi:NADH:ubiquinone oxidoreductase subunit 6 (subunit J)
MIYVVFVLFSLMVLGGGVLVVSSRNLVHSAGALVLSLFGVAGLFVLLEAGFLAAVQILVYIGAIAILIIFAVMLTRRVIDQQDSGMNSQWIESLVVAVLTLVLLIVIINTTWPFGAEAAEVVAVGDPTTNLGAALLDAYLLPFEVASVLLLAAMIGAIAIARAKQDE